MRKGFKHIYVTFRFFKIAALLTAAFILAYIFKGLFSIAILLFTIAVILVGIDALLLFTKNAVKANRVLPKKLSNGDDNPINISITNRYNFTIKAQVIDELPFQYQKRDFEMFCKINTQQQKHLEYSLRPLQRGEYHFGHLNIYVSSPLGLLTKRYQFGNAAMVPNYPSFLQLKKYMLLAFSNRLMDNGLKKIRRIGQTLEFEHIKDYVQGDDIRTINWKASAKRSQLMVNQYQDERSQPVYSVIDKGRAMKMPFNGLTLLDYAINATLVISNVALKKQDKAGMFTFSKKVENKVIAQRKPKQMHTIMETLYNVNTNFTEPDFSRLYVDINRTIKQRSLLLLYTNFETLDALHRQLPYLMAIAKKHLLVVVFFNNTELNAITQQAAKTTYQVIEKTVAEKFIYEKKLIANALQKHAIQTILTNPEDLTITTINKYLQLKAKGLF